MVSISEGWGLPVQLYISFSVVKSYAAWHACKIFSARRMSPLESLSRAFFPSSVIFTLERISSALEEILVLIQTDPLLGFNYINYSSINFFDRQRWETEACTTRLYGWCDLVYIVANNAKANVLGILFNDASKCALGCVGHHIRFVENNELEALAISNCYMTLKDMEIWTYLNNVRVSANCLICSLTTSIPRSSDAFNCNGAYLVASWMRYNVVGPPRFASYNPNHIYDAPLQGWYLSFRYQGDHRTIDEVVGFSQ